MVVSDLHLRILRRVAARTQADLDDHDASGEASQARRGELARIAAHARRRLVAAQARRRGLAYVKGPAPARTSEL
jgi:hypothetical protein